jgi:hypothetical protein
MSAVTGKRPWWPEPNEAVVDDLLVAASYATASFLAASPLDANNATSDDTDVNTIVLEEEDVQDAESNDDDDESDVDLTRELAGMMEEGDDDDDDGPQHGKRLDAERGCILVTAHELPSIYHSAATADCLTNSLAQLSTTAEESVLTKESNLELAGYIYAHMIPERVLVIQSCGAVASCNSLHGTAAAAVLNEGSQLVWGGTGTSTLVPLGRIHEVFGPVSQPLYSLKLPERLWRQSRH